MTFTRSIAVDAQTELSAYELRLLADASVELADQYERNAALMEDEEQRQVALALSEWRRTRARYFRELSAEAQRIEARLLASRELPVRASPISPQRAGARLITHG